MNAFKKCPGSGTQQMLAWFPDDEGYPGAVVCISCSFGVVVKRGSVHAAISGLGHEGLAGTLRVHYVTRGSHTEEPCMKYATTKGLPR